MGSRTRIFLVAVIVLFALYANLRVVRYEIHHLYLAGPTAGVSHVRVFDKMRESLPQRGIVGYVSDQNPTDSGTIWDYYQAEYALCPLLIVRNAEAPYIIVNCQATDGHCFVNSGYTLVKEFSNNTKLYQQNKQ